MGKIVTFGEVMLRLSPEGYNRFLQANKFEAIFGGAEANVAISLANYGLNAEFISKVPSHEIGQMAINAIRQYGVETKNIARGGNRLGIYYAEKGASMRASKVIYDRANSAISEADISDFDFDKIFEGATWFHFTGITPALSDNCAKLCEIACQKAHEKGLTISCDLNYRKKLWSKEKANEIMSKLAKYIDVCIANEEDAKDVFGIEASNTDIYSGNLNSDGYIDVAKKMTDKFNFKAVAITLRESYSASDNGWSGMLYIDHKAYFSKKYNIHIVDRVGGGDSFGGGLIFGFESQMSPQEIIEYAVAASALKQTIEGDINLVSKAEVTALANGDASGRVQR